MIDNDAHDQNITRANRKPRLLGLDGGVLAASSWPPTLMMMLSTRRYGWCPHLACSSLRFRRDAGCDGSLAHFYAAPGTAFRRRRYGQILGPRRHLPKFANCLCRHPDVWVGLDLHPSWPAAKKRLERGNTFHFASH
jgi:hypothetical protein